MTKSKETALERHRRKNAARGRIRGEYSATPVHHAKLKKELKKLQDNDEGMP